MKLARMLKHLVAPDWATIRHAFPPAALNRIEEAIVASERRHLGELRFVVEGGLHLSLLLRDKTPRERAIDVFSGLRVWDTEHNSGVLVYVQFVDHDVEIVADRGISARVPQATWNAVCAELEQAYRRREFEAGTLKAIAAITDLLSEHFPPQGPNPNELSNRPLIL